MVEHLLYIEYKSQIDIVEIENYSNNIRDNFCDAFALIMHFAMTEWAPLQVSLQ